MTTRRQFLAAGGALGLASVTSGAARAQESRRWRMVTSWPKNLPGPGVSAERLARRIAQATGGRITVEVYAAGELVPSLGVLDAVAQGTAEMAHTASFFWAGKMPAAVFFTAVPFGLTADEHAAWIAEGGGQELWDRLYAPFGVKPFMGGNTGMQMGGWFNREIAGLDDLRGLKIRMPGLGGEVLRRLGATPVTVPPGEIVQALQSGVVDAVEFLGPWSDLAAGFHQAARYYYWPGWHEPNGAGEALVSLEAWRGLDEALQAAVAEACRAEEAHARTEAKWNNAVSLQRLVDEFGVTLAPFPDEVLAAMRELSDEVLARFAGSGGIDAEIRSSYVAARDLLAAWSRVGVGAFLAARHA